MKSIKHKNRFNPGEVSMKRFWLFGVLAAVALTAAACGGGGGSTPTPTGDLTAVSVKSSTSTGDFTPNVIAGLGTGGTLQFTIGGVDIDNDGTVDTPAAGVITASSGALAMVAKAVSDTEVTCVASEIGGTTSSAYDIGISLDTTASMGAAAGVLANKIAAFTTSLADAGVDAQFAGITVGDEFATKASPSLFTDPGALGTLGVPTPVENSDSPPPPTCERPDTGATLLGATAMAAFFNDVSTVYGAGGCFGTDATENYLGSVSFITTNVTKRSGSIPIIISIGDNCAHTPTTFPLITNYNAATDAIFLPPDPVAFAAGLAGRARVNVIGNTEDLLNCTAGGYYNMKGLADATGGSFIDMGGFGACNDAATCPVDLTQDAILGAITKSIVETCDGLSSFYGGSGDYTFRIPVTVIGADGVARTATTVIVLTLTFA